VRKIIDRWGMPALTNRTITDYEELLAELETVREQGYAVNDQEELEGLRAVAIAVNEPDGSVFGTLDISGPPYRLPDVEEVAAQLRPVVSDLEADIRAAGSG
jgi:DNA-binding IclR family transcriptional regulator